MISVSDQLDFSLLPEPQKEISRKLLRDVLAELERSTIDLSCEGLDAVIAIAVTEINHRFGIESFDP